MGLHHFVRHGQASHNIAPELIGGQAHDATLTERGRRQARLFGHYMRAQVLRPTYVAHSGATRAQDTCKIAVVTADLSIDPVIDPRLHEVSQGAAEGMPRVDVYTPEYVRYLQEAGLDGKYPDGGESIRDVQQRMVEAMYATEREQPEGTMMYFSHGLAIRALAGHVLDLPKSTILELTTENLSITTITIGDDGRATVRDIGKTVINE